MQKKKDSKYTIKQILKENIVRFVVTYFFKKSHLFRKTVFENIYKTLTCKETGWSVYRCPEHPKKTKIVPHTCKSRSCNSCGTHATNQWGKWLNDNFPNKPVFHITFTLPDDLRNFFYRKRKYLYLVAKASAETIITWFNKRKKVLPAISVTIHTFGARLNWHIHNHVVVSTGGLNTKTKRWINVSEIPESFLKKAFKAILLKYIRKGLIDFGLTDWQINDIYKKSWYVQVKAVEDRKDIIGYIGRYTKHPPIAQSRILEYGRGFITYLYKDYYEERIKPFVCSVMDFIHLFIIHIPEKHQKYIYHYGLMANRVITKYQWLLKRIGLLPWKVKRMLSWRERIYEYTKKDPLRCPICDLDMEFVDVCFSNDVDYPRILTRYEVLLRG